MRAHNVFDAMEKTHVSDDAPGGLASEVLITKMLLQQSVTFDFGALSPPREHVEFGLDLLARRMLRLPYDVTFFSCGDGFFVAHAMPDNAEQLMGDLAEWGYLDGLPKEARKVPTPGELQIIKINIHEGACIPTIRVNATGHYPADNLECTWWDITGLASGKSELSEAAACAPVSIVCGLVAMLASKEVTSERIAPPEKVNKARERKGRPKINDVYDVRINVRLAAASESGGGGHASPRMHWRRGHYRRLGDRLVPVAPCLVNASDAAAALDPKDYVFPSAVGWNATRKTRLQ
jgi:hypothetical protein